MNMKVFLLVCFFHLLASLYPFFIMQDAVLSIFYLGKSKSMKRKIQKKYSLKQRFYLHHVYEQADSCKQYLDRLKRLLQMRKICLVVIAVFTLLLFLFLVGILPVMVWRCCFFVEMAVLDIPVSIWLMLMTKHDKKHGGVMWRWEESK